MSQKIYEGDDSDANGDSSIDALDRRTVLRSGAVLVGGSAMAGCLGDDEGDDGEGANGEDETTHIAIVSSPAGFDDRAFNDNALEGLQEAAEEWDIEINDVEETEEAEYESVQANLAEEGRYGVIVLVGFNHLDALETNVDQYPDQNWMLINDHIEGAENLSGWIEMNNEMSFLAGVAAGTLTQEEIEHGDSSTDPTQGIVGFAGGEDVDLINAFERSYVEGVEWVDDGIEVLTGYGGSFDDASALADVAGSQFDDGADIVWHAASAAGAGAFSSARDNGRFALGVDVDQSVADEQYADVILGSAVKALNEATYQVAEAIVNDDWESVSGEQNLSIEQEGIDFVVGQEFEGELPASLDENLERAKSEFIDGEIELSCGPTGC